MIAIRLLVNSRLLAIKVLRIQKLCTDFQPQGQHHSPLDCSRVSCVCKTLFSWESQSWSYVRVWEAWHSGIGGFSEVECVQIERFSAVLVCSLEKGCCPPANHDLQELGCWSGYFFEWLLSRSVHCPSLLTFRTGGLSPNVFQKLGLLLICSLLDTWSKAVNWLLSRNRPQEWGYNCLADFQSMCTHTKLTRINNAYLFTAWEFGRRIVFSWVWKRNTFHSQFLSLISLQPNLQERP